MTEDKVGLLVWKKYQSDKQSKSKIKLAVIALSGLVLLLILAKVISFFGSLNDSSLGLRVHESNFNWNSGAAANLVFIKQTGPDQEISLVNFQPKIKKITIMHLSNQIYVDLPKNYGFWTLGSVFKLGQEDKNQGAVLVKLAVSKLTGLPIDGIVILTNSDSKIEDQISSWRKNPLNMIVLLTKVKTDLKTPDLLSFLYQASSVRSDKISSLDMAQTTLTKSKLLPDSSRVLGIDNIKLDVFIRDKLQDAGMAEETYSVAIFNATEHPGLGSEVARVVTNLGGTVTMISNSQLYQQKSLVLAQKEADSKSITFQRLAGVYAPTCLQEKCVSPDPKISGSRGQINIVIGEDYYNYWYLR